MENKEELNCEESKISKDQVFTSEIIYDSIVENYGQPAVDTVLGKLEIHRTDLSLGDNSKIILQILNGDL